MIKSYEVIFFLILLNHFFNICLNIQQNHKTFYFIGFFHKFLEDQSFGVYSDGSWDHYALKLLTVPVILEVYDIFYTNSTLK